METDLARMLQGIDWEGIRGEKEAISTASSTNLSPQQQSNGQMPLTEGCAPAPVDRAVGGDVATSSSILTSQPPAIPMAPTGSAYYVNPTPYQPVGVPPGHNRVQVPSQPVMFAPPNGQMVYMQVPYFRQPPYQHGPPAQRLYPFPPNPNYPTHFVQHSVDGQVAHVIPQQQQQQYRAPQLYQSRGTPVSGSTQQQQQPDPTDYQGGLVNLIPGSSLPEGAPFFPHGVRPTRHYTTPQAQETRLKLSLCNNHVLQATLEPVDKSEGRLKNEDKSMSEVPASPIFLQSKNVSENAPRSHMRAKHDGDKEPSVTVHNADNTTNTAFVIDNNTADKNKGGNTWSAIDQ